MLSGKFHETAIYDQHLLQFHFNSVLFARYVITLIVIRPLSMIPALQRTVTLPYSAMPVLYHLCVA